MSARLRAFVALSAAAASAALGLALAQGLRARAGETKAAQRQQTEAQQRQAAEPIPPAPTPTPTPYAAPFPALKRGASAFEPFVRLSGGRRLESYSVSDEPARKDLKVTADYPVLVGDPGRAAREFNRLTHDFVLDAVTPYLESGPDPEKERDPFWKDAEEWRSVSHTVVYASDELVSVLFYVEGYNWGAGHSYHQPVSFNFDLKAGRELKLRDLFKPGSRHLERIARLCEEDLARQFPTVPVMRTGLKPTRKNFARWVFTPGGLVFVFEEYQLVAYAEGEPKVLIPFERLKGLVRPGGALAALAPGAE